MSKWSNFNDTLQSHKMTCANGSVMIIEGEVPDTDVAVSGVSYNVKCPWQLSFGVGNNWNLKIVYGQDLDTALKVYQNHPIAQQAIALDDDVGYGYHTNFYRLFLKLPNSQPGILPSDFNLADDYRTQLEGQDVIKHNMIVDMDMTDYSVSYEIDMDIETNKARILSLPIVDENQFVPNIMLASRPSFPGYKTHLKENQMSCVRFMPVQRTFESYDTYNNGLHLQFANEELTISKKGTFDFLVFAQPVTVGEVTVPRSRPVNLTSDSITIPAGATNMVLHIWK